MTNPTPSKFVDIVRQIIESEGLSQVLFEVIEAFEEAELPVATREALTDLVRMLGPLASDVCAVEDNLPTVDTYLD